MVKAVIPQTKFLVYWFVKTTYSELWFMFSPTINQQFTIQFLFGENAHGFPCEVLDSGLQRLVYVWPLP
jgi:hypothetical protein